MQHPFLTKNTREVPAMVQRLTNLTSIHVVVALIPGLAQWVKDLVVLCAMA